VDTRSKIAGSFEQARQACRARGAQSPLVVRGRFDPLLAAHARRLADLKAQADALIVLIEEAPGDLLPAPARAAIAAGLAVVDSVAVIAPGDPLPADVRAIDERTADEVRRGALMERVREAHGRGPDKGD
jgi:hypothetical protein